MQGAVLAAGVAAADAALLAETVALDLAVAAGLRVGAFAVWAVTIWEGVKAMARRRAVRRERNVGPA